MSNPGDKEQELREIYRRRVLEHSRQPHHFGRPSGTNREALGFNPLCGDKLSVYAELEDGRIADIGFDGSGCAISMASASMMTDALLGRRIEDADRMVAAVSAMLSAGAPLQEESLAELSALEGVRDYPSRIKCATLAWNTLTAALHQTADQVSTE